MSKREVPLPHVDPHVSVPRAVAYKAAIESRKFNPPVGGGPMPPVPNLTRELAAEGPAMSMSEHALKERAQVASMDISKLLDNPNSILSGQPSAPSSSSPGILSSDLLPEAAKQDPNYREGAGSIYAVNQPHLAAKYGVIRQGSHIPPQALNPPKAGTGKLSDKSVKGLEDVIKFQQMRAQAESGDAKAEQDAARGPAAATAKLGNAPGDDSPHPLTPEERKEFTQTVARKMDDFDFDTFRQMMMKDLLNNPEQKDIVEERIKPMDISDLIMEGSVAQEVILVPGKFWVVFRSVSGEDDLAVKRLLMQEAKTVQVDDRYYLDKFAFMTLTLGLESICGNPLPGCKDVKGRFNEEQFWKKYDFVTSLNIHMIASLGVNYFWYDVRVRKLFVAEKVKNG